MAYLFKCFEICIDSMCHYNLAAYVSLYMQPLLDKNVVVKLYIHMDVMEITIMV